MFLPAQKHPTFEDFALKQANFVNILICPERGSVWHPARPVKQKLQIAQYWKLRG
jgi:hypothetical protein